MRRSDMARAAWLGAVPGVVLFSIMQVLRYTAEGAVGIDSHAYWVALQDTASWYTRSPGETDAYLYSPLFAQLLTPLRVLPWPAFQLVWLAAQLAILAWLLRPLPWWKAMVVVLALTPELLIGNIYLFLAASLVLTVRGNAEALLLPSLTKVTSAAVVIWYVARREWPLVLRATLTGAVLVGVSAAISPSAWLEWVHLVLASSGSQGATFFVPRACVALALIVYAAASRRAWLLAPAMTLITPVFNGAPVMAVLAAIPRLLTDARADADMTRSEQPDDDLTTPSGPVLGRRKSRRASFVWQHLTILPVTRPQDDGGEHRRDEAAAKHG